MARRRFPIGSSLKRKYGICDPKIKIVVVCEGQKTEPDYLKKLKREHSNQLVELIILRGIGVPITIVDRAIIEQKKLKREARKSGNSFDKNFQVWGVFDVDDHPQIPEAIQKANSSNIRIAISNPCFELWPVLHFCDYDQPTHRHEMQKHLMRLMPNYNSGKGKKIDFDLIKANYKIAQERAINQLNSRDLEGDPKGNPSTNFFELTDQIISNGKEKSDCLA